ncbi:hypothetical protein RRG08_055307 [Elysia crispata]|uniref:Uncharacterized protein n=1 Tax=Elysia crispata TaxID=231223 RepID=A0AAE1AQU6_9GAST|nr:hypothetical protein RRG08_055307 [Elysia crispata]
MGAQRPNNQPRDQRIKSMQSRCLQGQSVPQVATSSKALFGSLSRTVLKQKRTFSSSKKKKATTANSITRQRGNLAWAFTTNKQHHARDRTVAVRDGRNKGLSIVDWRWNCEPLSRHSLLFEESRARLETKAPPPIAINL